MPVRVTLSLISHTNVGKTTLARTLLRRDVGEVRDEEHVTDTSEAFLLVEAPGCELILWDTPGFGATPRLMRRLRREGDPLGWLLHQVWDRFLDRPLFCSQQAARNVRDEADLVLYLVNAAEEPEHAGYVALELDLLQWIGRPVLVLLNQLGREDEAEVEARWRQLVERWAVVRDVLPLDAFNRCWTEEDRLLQRVAPLLAESKRGPMEKLAEAWNRRNLEVFRHSCEAMADYLARAAADAESVQTGAQPGTERGSLGRLGDALLFSVRDKRRAMKALSARLDEATRRLMEQLIAMHGLEGESLARIEREIQDFQVRGVRALDERSGAIAGAVISGALGGLAADALSGGLSLGGGMIAGGILGALGGSALARGYRWVSGDRAPSVRWSPEFLERLLRQLLLRYLAVAHFGRGRGAYRDLDQPQRWIGAVDDELRSQGTEWAALWRLGEEPGGDTADEFRRRGSELIERASRAILCRAHPGAQRLLSSEPHPDG